MSNINKNNIALAIEKIKNIIVLKTELYEELYNFLDELLKINNLNSTQPSTTPITIPSTINKSKFFIPYLYLASDNKINIEDYIRKTKCKNFMLAFLNDMNGIIQWSNRKSYSDLFLLDDINYIKNNGGKIFISTGGADGREIIKTNTVDKCFEVIEYLYNMYKIDGFDFDVEGSEVGNVTHRDKRVKLITKLKKTYPNMKIGYTLPVEPDGLRDDALSIIKETYKYTTVDYINLMTMDFGNYYAPNGKTDMHKYCIESIKTVENQLENLKIKTKISVTPMIGQNDVSNEVFNLDNAKKLIEYVNTNNKILFTSFWCINRDNGKKISTSANCNYSGIQQNDYDFSKIFNNTM